MLRHDVGALVSSREVEQRGGADVGHARVLCAQVDHRETAGGAARTGGDAT